MNLRNSVVLSVTALVAYTWLAAFVWHQLPTVKGEIQWWELPAFITTGICGVGLYLAVGLWERK